MVSYKFIRKKHLLNRVFLFFYTFITISYINFTFLSLVSARCDLIMIAFATVPVVGSLGISSSSLLLSLLSSYFFNYGLLSFTDYDII
jgi:hypothetical protein